MSDLGWEEGWTDRDSVRFGRNVLRRGDRVRLKPCYSADALDLLLDGKEAVIEAIEEDLEGKVYLSVTILDDPGRDLGIAGKPGHRFYFHPEEVEPLGPSDEPADVS
jgi:hypothetical protein